MLVSSGLSVSFVALAISDDCYSISIITMNATATASAFFERQPSLCVFVLVCASFLPMCIAFQSAIIPYGTQLLKSLHLHLVHWIYQWLVFVDDLLSLLQLRGGSFAAPFYFAAQKPFL